ncbi:1,3-beta-glucan synthase component-domain-containing protein [Syncephalis plumigaleata]|nr:1,3-beta-glucan synthase component-domain-containing protein [Syncephalis plumigaleata]
MAANEQNNVTRQPSLPRFRPQPNLPAPESAARQPSPTESGRAVISRSASSDYIRNNTYNPANNNNTNNNNDNYSSPDPYGRDSPYHHQHEQRNNSDSNSNSTSPLLRRSPSVPHTRSHGQTPPYHLHPDNSYFGDHPNGGQSSGSHDESNNSYLQRPYEPVRRHSAEDTTPPRGGGRRNFDGNQEQIAMPTVPMVAVSPTTMLSPNSSSYPVSSRASPVSPAGAAQAWSPLLGGQNDPYAADPRNQHTSWGSQNTVDSTNSETHLRNSPPNAYAMSEQRSNRRTSGLRESFTPDDFYQNPHNAQASVSSLYPPTMAATASVGLSTAASARTGDVDLLSALRDTNLDSSRYAMFSPSSESLLATMEHRKLSRGGASQASLYTTAQSQAASGRVTPMRRRQESNSTMMRESLPAPADHWYPAWPEDESEVPISIREIRGIFQRLQRRFGFQVDNARNQYDAFMRMLDSRYPAHQTWRAGSSSNDGGSVEDQKSLPAAEHVWRVRMQRMSPYMRVRQIALWLLIWGEASVIRFMPECLCFLFKLADDSLDVCEPGTEDAQTRFDTNAFLNDVITPIYQYIREQAYEIRDGKYVKRERDHATTVGYDDCNELFWTREGIQRIRIKGPARTRLVEIPAEARYAQLGHVDWTLAFRKSYKERRTFLHLLVNFPRIWIFTVPLTIASQGGSIATIIMLLATICEFFFVRTRWNASSILLSRITWLVIILLIHLAPTVYIIKFSICLFNRLYRHLLTVPSGRLFRRNGKSKSKQDANLAIRTFTASFPTLKPTERAVSIGMWTCVFLSKFLESYFFLALSFKDALKAMIDIPQTECSAFAGMQFCQGIGYLTLIVVTSLDLLLFFLDTYLWYIIWNAIFSVCRSFYLGISIYSPWRNIFSRLPKRIYAKLIANSDMAIRGKPRLLASQVKMMYQQTPSEDGRKQLKEPTFFIAQEDSSLKGEYFERGSEAERRFSYFAQSLATLLPEPMGVERMPTFTVLTPHYGEKILLSLKEIIRENDKQTRITLLEYLKKMHRTEWDNFVKDSKLLAEEMPELAEPSINLGNLMIHARLWEQNGLVDGSPQSNTQLDDIAYQTIGYKSATPEFTLRTRIWASLRSQTLYRTVSGFMNYSRALRLLYRVEHPECPQGMLGEMHADQHAKRKFCFLISMQRYTKFDAEELECVEFLFKAYPDLQIAYLEEEKSEQGGSIEPRIYSVLIDGRCEIMPDGRRKPKYRIQLPGNPILGDGKSDNQNHAIIFMRGEYLQLIDANQDNYLEEALKIRNILAEFEEFEGDVNCQDPYGEGVHYPPPVAIVGAREFIFSQSVGVLGDVAAGKETTFGTLAHRIMAKMGGKLHYGHPDFLNAIYMNTRGGVSKATKGLHLNEDIYAGMNAFERGGRIKHTEYFQCGKGRDLGFCSVLNFNTKIGTGMAEQFLSREHYYIGTQLPLDRFLTFFYAHPGFQINNIQIMLATQLFMYSLVLIGVLGKSILICDELPENASPDAQLMPPGCFNLWPIILWMKRCVISVLAVFFVAFLPLFLQMVTEQGFLRALARLGKQLFSMSPLFEVFATQIYSHSIMSNLSFGGARYIGTGRGVAITRMPFATLYSRFAGSAIYLGVRLVLMLLFASVTIWIPHLSYFWITNVALCIAPFFFNPHQFIPSEFIIDYRAWLRWMSAGNVRSESNSARGVASVPRASKLTMFWTELFLPIVLAFIVTFAYVFAKRYEGFDQPMAGIAHGWAVINLIGTFMILYMLEEWRSSYTVLGVMAMVTIQRAVFALMTTFLLTREYDQDASNLAWWTGKWRGRGLGWGGILQPLREYCCKIVESSLFAVDFIAGHFILFVLSLFCLVPWMDRWHTAILFWLPPSRQFRRPIYSMRERSRRRRICVGYAKFSTQINYQIDQV